MLNKDDDYRREAADCEKLADKATNERDRATWHRIAQLWLDLIKSDDPGKWAHK